MDHYTLLRNHIEAICTLTDEEWEFVRGYFHHKKLRKHQFLVQKGDPVPFEFWIIQGLIKAYALDEDGKEHILQFGMENYWVSDHYAYQNKVPATLYVDCIEDSDFFCLKLEDREYMCQQIPAMANFFRTKSNLGYIALQQRILSLLTETAEQRYSKLIKKLPRLIQRVPKKLLASYLGVTRETLSRLKG
ncbi:Crp/Fnr family transcriptional regulator [Flavobacterium kingsejongi]|uniref:Crp/Fnr family transcriptional regulator n=1 Tax=Flavobacterium kingsejongi TaxID=1678728 RepID=A0A2S1LTZ0_9FLAO|nr:Crp/Fnr family transcriptional regulator [Flavobacterium kingsejongi]AWG27184.1 Crp/Fnr family transcriptional regulator [Flavobacterium kingsejongi]